MGSCLSFSLCVCVRFRERERGSRNTMTVVIEVQRAAGSNRQLCWVGCHTNCHLGRGSLKQGVASTISACGQVCGDVFKIEDWCGRAQLSVDGAISAWVVMGGIRKQAEKGSKQDSSMVSAFRKLGSQLHPSFSKLLFVSVSSQPKKANRDSCVLNCKLAS